MNMRNYDVEVPICVVFTVGAPDEKAALALVPGALEKLEAAAIAAKFEGGVTFDHLTNLEDSQAWEEGELSYRSKPAKPANLANKIADFWNRFEKMHRDRRPADIGSDDQHPRQGGIAK
jgi:hypothetical protein